MRNQFITALLLAGSLLTACGTSQPTAQGRQTHPAGLSSLSLTAASGTSLRTVQADLVATTSFSTPGLPAQTSQTPVGLKVAYLFNGSQTKTRLDMPGSSFADGRARIALYDTANSAARVVFADTLAQDSSIDTTQLAALLQPQTAMGTGTSGTAYQTQTSTTFKSSMTARNIPTTDTTVTQNGTTTAVVQATQSLNNPNGGTQQTLSYFDPQAGVVTQVKNTLTTPEGTQSSTGTYTYDTVTNLPNVRIPTHIHTDGQLQASATGQTVTVTQDVDYRNAQLNTLPDSYFNIGGL